MACELRTSDPPQRRKRRAPLPALLAVAALASLPLLAARPATAQQAGYGQTLGTTPMERQLYDGGNPRPGSGSILDTANPIELMNKIRRGTAMDDATPPASAIDQALQQLEAQSSPAGRPGAAGGTAAPARTGAAASGSMSPHAGHTAPAAGASARPVATTPVWTAPSQSQPLTTPQRPAL